MTKSILTIVGARPQFIKAAPLSIAFRKSIYLTEEVLHTGQHYDNAMSSIFFEELGMAEPKWNLALGGGGHGMMTGRMLEAIESTILEFKPDMIVVFGDTNSTMAGALAAAKLRIPVAHIEAGLRSFNFYQPEEINRVVTDRVSELLFCPTDLAANNLKNENVQGEIEIVGDIMFDTVLLAQKLSLTKLDFVTSFNPGSYYLSTLHRAENVDNPKRLANIVDYIREQANGYPIVFPVHPRTEAKLREFDISLFGFVKINPVGYLEMIKLLDNAKMLFTDSGGLQKESFFCQTRCVTLRDETEWLETIDLGWNRLWTTEFFKEKQHKHVYGDGNAATKIVESIEAYFGSH